MTRLTGKVAAIVNDRELVINRGEEHGVTLGMRFVVLATEGGEVRDPDTDEVLGSVPLEKASVKVVRVQPRLCVARTFRTIAGNPGFPSALFAGTKAEPERLHSQEESLEGRLADEVFNIVIGDPVVETKGDEYQ